MKNISFVITVLCILSVSMMPPLRAFEFHDVSFFITNPFEGANVKGFNESRAECFGTNLRGDADSPEGFSYDVTNRFKCPMFMQTPGLVAYDFNGDWLHDQYVTTGYGKDNKFFISRVDSPDPDVEWYTSDSCEQAGVCLRYHDSAGACYGDFNNDRNIDIIVTSNSEGSRYLQGNSDGTFTDISDETGFYNKTFGHFARGCVATDFNKDGYTDLLIWNYFNVSTKNPIYITDPWESQENFLYINDGEGGFDLFRTFPPYTTWQDVFAPALDRSNGNIHILSVNDQASIAPNPYDPSTWKGRFIYYENQDGEGNFTDASFEKDIWTLTNPPSVPDFRVPYKVRAWMSVNLKSMRHLKECIDKWGFNVTCLDMYATEFGQQEGLMASDLAASQFYQPYSNPPYIPNAQASTWLFTNPDGTIEDQFSGFITDPNNPLSPGFGWGSTITSFDNTFGVCAAQGGGMTMGIMRFCAHVKLHVMCQKKGAPYGNFERYIPGGQYDDLLLSDTNGLVAADVNGDGRMDLITVSEGEHDPERVQTYDPDEYFGEPLPSWVIQDDHVKWSPGHLATNCTHRRELGCRYWYDHSRTQNTESYLPGKHRVYLNKRAEGEPEYNSILVRLVGGKGTLNENYGPRKLNSWDGFGGVVQYEPLDSCYEGENVFDVEPSVSVLGGDSFAAQQPPEAHGGMETAECVNVHVQWNGGGDGAWNTLYNVHLDTNTRLKFYQLDCDAKDKNITPGQYIFCVTRAIHEWRKNGDINFFTGVKYFASAVKAWNRYHDNEHQCM